LVIPSIDTAPNGYVWYHVHLMTEAQIQIASGAMKHSSDCLQKVVQHWKIHLEVTSATIWSLTHTAGILRLKDQGFPLKGRSHFC